MPIGDLTEDDPELGQNPGGAPPGGQPTPGGPPPAAGAPGGGGPQPGGLAAFVRSRMGPQVSTPGPGNAADSTMLLQQAIGTMQQAMLGLPPGSPLFRDVNKAIGTLSRHLGGMASMGPAMGVQKTMLGDQLRRTVQQQLIQRLFGQQRGKQPGPMGGGPQPPMPSTPLPGA